MIQDLFEPYFVSEELHSGYDGLTNLAATVETIEFTVGMEDSNIEAAFKEDSVEELLDVITLMEESCQREGERFGLLTSPCSLFVMVARL
ncbi:hypothetical protein CSAL01_00570 [Colletotrichum salicis]|uniref:Uncharacterized protein n=1 Tax=Colletotrichum salicis TaxID=1209931 RepID=A0A135UPX5_9PEZI|nr:hypothetical protein CSAL01_00570 [Colletotrichum salicis]